MKPFQFRLTVLNVIAAVSVASITQVSAAQQEHQSVQFINHNKSNSLPFSEAVKVNHTLYLSGQIGLDNNTKQLVMGGVEAETLATLSNIKHTLMQSDYQLSDVVKCTVMLADINDFGKFNQVYSAFFKPPYPAEVLLVSAV
ncbi:Rid family hydrolase [Shewanella sp. MF05960]|uniref:Rid family hydrolase n=1 Tax=Shewanella sp. MF05960 TaxID=3434874 RepID=UPI003D7B7EA0